MPTSNQTDNDTDLIYAYSFDYDGCMAVFNDLKRFKDNWEHCVSHIKAISAIIHSAKNLKVAQIVLMNGSARQSAKHDLCCRIHFFDRDDRDTESALYFLADLETYLKRILEPIGGQYAAKIKIDPFLMSDLRDKVEHGTNFNMALNSSCLGRFYNTKDELNTAHNKLTEQQFIGDHTKASLLYAQIHKLTSENENKTIIFHFYDDNNEIIDDLLFTYSCNKNWLPRNVILYINLYPLYIHSYQHDPHTSFPIQGTGATDRNYQKNSLILRDLILINELSTALHQFKKKLQDDYKNHEAALAISTPPPAHTPTTPVILATTALDTLRAINEIQQNKSHKGPISNNRKGNIAAEITLSVYKLSYPRNELMFFNIPTSDTPKEDKEVFIPRSILV